MCNDTIAKTVPAGKSADAYQPSPAVAADPYLAIAFLPLAKVAAMLAAQVAP
ncbi:MAG: hypothetical protein WKG00_18190 [Polyangiaceae bacterium]